MRCVRCLLRLQGLQGQVARSAAQHGALRQASSEAQHGALPQASSGAQHGALPQASSGAQHGALRQASSAAQHGALPQASSEAQHGALRQASSGAQHGALPLASSEAQHGALRQASSQPRSAAQHGALPQASSEAQHGALRQASSAAQHGALRPASSQPHMLRNTQHQVIRRFHSSPINAKNQPIPAEFIDEDDDQKDKSLVVHDDLFEQVAMETKTKAAFNQVVEVFLKQDVRRRGHVEFIYAALQKMREFGVERDLATYNRLLDVFPKEVFVPRNFIQTMFNHYPRQQECGVQLLEQMEGYGILPNVDTRVLLIQIFGVKGHPVRKYQRIMYWFPKFKHTNPYPIPKTLPEDPVDLARFSLARIADDRDAKVTVFQLAYTDVTESGEEVTLPHVVGIQSPSQVALLAQHNPLRPVFVEGPFPLWLRDRCVHYYVLRADPVPAEEKVEEPYDPERCFDYPLELDLDLDRDLGDVESFDVEDLDEGAVFAMCMTSQGDQSVLNQWVSSLQQTNPILGRVPTLFRLEQGPRGLQGPGPQTQREEEEEEEEEGSLEEEQRTSQGMKQ